MKNEYVVRGSLGMKPGAVLRVDDGRDLLIYVWEGALWLTQEGDLSDRYLAAGSWFRLDRNGVAIAQATARSTITLTAPVSEQYAARIALGEVELYSAAREKAPLSARLPRLWSGLFAPHARPTRAAL